MNISPHTPTPSTSNLSALKEATLRKATQAGQFLSRSVTNLGNTLKSGFTATYNFAKSIGKKVFGESTPLSPEEKAALAKAKQEKAADLDKSLGNMFPWER